MTLSNFACKGEPAGVWVFELGKLTFCIVSVEALKISAMLMLSRESGLTTTVG
jgi:hypothetical protein